VNDQPVTVTAVKALAPCLVEIHGQNEQIRCWRATPNLICWINLRPRGNCWNKSRRFSPTRELEREKESLSQNEQDRLRTLGLAEFSSAGNWSGRQLEPGEDARLEEEKRLLANLERIRTSAVEAYSQLYEDQGSVCSRLAGVARAIEDLERYVSVVQPYREPLASAQAALEDLAFFPARLPGAAGSQPAPVGRGGGPVGFD